MITTSYWRVNPDLTALGIITGSVMLVFFLIGLPSNILIIISIILQKLYRQPTHLLLLSLALADILMCLLVMPFIIISGIAGEFVLGESDYARCKVCQLGIALVPLGTFSLHILALMSLDRFLFIRYPLRYDNIVTKNKVMTSIVAISILSILLGIPPLFGFGDIYFDHPTFSCSPRFDYMTKVTKNVYYLVVVAVEAMLPLSMLITTNVGILYIAQRHIKQIYNTKKSLNNASQLENYHQKLKIKLCQEKYRKQLQLMRTFGAIFIAHMITWTPLIIRIFESLIRDSDNHSQWSNFIVITSINSLPALHPLLEAWILPEIRRYLTMKFTSLCCRNKPNAAETKENSLCLWNCCNNCVETFSATVILPQTELVQIQNDVYTQNKD